MVVAVVWLVSVDCVKRNVMLLWYHHFLAAVDLNTMDMETHNEMNMEDMDMEDMEMVMTFGSWSDYQLKLLFDFWNIETKGQFALSWIVVVMAACSYHGLKYLISHLEIRIIRSGTYENIGIDGGVDRKRWWWCGSRRQGMERLLHAFMSAINYGLALMLMLVTMTYNPLLFLAAVIGYGIGDFIFFHCTPTKTDQACH